MTDEEQALWQGIQDFQIDAPNASYPYSKRLARENGWTPAYTARVIHEYRKFAFLSVAAGHGVTPSKAVDEAWHLHLLYTRNYWDEFCPKALGRPIHHNPSGGNSEEEMKFQDWYRNTLHSYERLFGEPPPTDIWPRGDEPRKVRRRWWPLSVLLTVFLAGCQEPANPLDWHGPAFLQFFALLVMMAFTLAGLARWWIRFPAEGPPADEWDLHPYDKAYLNAGEQLALATALAHLSAQKLVAIDRATGRLRSTGCVQDASHPLERAILIAGEQSGGILYAEIRRRCVSHLEDIRASLRRQGLLIPPEMLPKAILLPFLIALLPFLLGAVKIAIGVSRDRPVEFLVLGCAFGVAFSAMFLIAPRRSRYGDAVLAELQNECRALRARSKRSIIEPFDLALGVALFGLGTLNDTPYEHLRTAIVPLSGDGGSSSSCGSSSCGGGGCGGGGCGGCSS